jgi:hypothetical protein
MSSSADVPEAYRQFFFVNAGGPMRQVVGRDVVQKKWQLVTLACAHRILLPKYQKSAKVGCGFCGGLEPLAVPPAGVAGDPDGGPNLARVVALRHLRLALEGVQKAGPDTAAPRHERN